MDHSYDIHDDPHPLLRTRHLARRTAVLSSETATSAAAVLALLAEETAKGRSEPLDPVRPPRETTCFG